MAFTSTPYSYGIRNLYRPTSLISNAYGWSTMPHYNRADVPTGLMNKPGAMTDSEFLQNFAYEWFQSEQLGGDSNLSNPPFATGAAGRLHPTLRDSETGKPARILRGYIRRAQSEVGNNVSKARLYFMYNPEQITRDYVSYLNQAALDPFNSVYQSGNLVAPPSFLDFSFALFFDRQEEARNAKHPGVFVDYQFFDLVVRNVIPSDPNQSSATLPDNGVMMVNPQDITVIFSPQLSVQGRPLNASVSFEKFTHRMTPTRMMIQLQMRVIYMGPAKDNVEYKAEELQAEAAIPWGDTPTEFNLTYISNEDSADAVLQDPAAAAGSSASNEMLLISQGNIDARNKALDWAMSTVRQGGPNDPNATKYVGSTNAGRHDLPTSCDDAGLITEAYRQVGAAQKMGWEAWPGVSTIFDLMNANPQKQQSISLRRFDYTKQLNRGDILILNGGSGRSHIMWFVRYEGDKMFIFDANAATASPQVGERQWAGPGDYSYFLLRPCPFGATSGIVNTPANLGINHGDYGANPEIGNVGGTLQRAQTVVALTGQGNDIRLSPAALPAWNLWRNLWGGPIPCTSGWRDPIKQQESYNSNPKRFAPANKSFHCKGTAVDVNMDWLGQMSASEQSRFRIAARNSGWRQARWRKKEGPVPGYEAPCNPQNGTKTDEPWHFSWGGCG